MLTACHELATAAGLPASRAAAQSQILHAVPPDHHGTNHHTTSLLRYTFTGWVRLHNLRH